MALFSAFGITGCIAPPSNTLVLAPEIVVPNQDLSVSAVSINIVSYDKRDNPVLATIERNGQLENLMPNRDVRFLLQEILEKQMIARGYAVGGNAPINVQIILNKLNADVKEGNFRHLINASAEITIVAGSVSGMQQSKTYRSSYNVEGPLTASNAKIEEVLNTVLTNIVAEMSQDTSVSNFIRAR
nr:YajG family lipoprotein [Thorsellia anophelis]